ncbi:uncharacterized protein LOC128394029 [Panonychus citri]|uniref:uncharacterized protein LOC128394029 n=1 Tax=Panonychus citri TaxID=50023 RepID=UPI0023077554|nr:uncharacterized protein LOC128394029 [Panonychus citri]
MLTTFDECDYPEVCNIVTLWNLNKKIQIIGNSGKKKKFNADIYKSGKNRLLVFGSGKVIATGFKTEQDTREFITKTFKEVQFLKIVNITASKKLKTVISAKSIFESDLNVIYEPELFPALNWKDEGVSFIYYPKGSLILTGIKSLDQLKKAYRSFENRFCLKN